MPCGPGKAQESKGKGALGAEMCPLMPPVGKVALGAKKCLVVIRYKETKSKESGTQSCSSLLYTTGPKAQQHGRNILAFILEPESMR